MEASEDEVGGGSWKENQSFLSSRNHGTSHWLPLLFIYLQHPARLYYIRAIIVYNNLCSVIIIVQFTIHNSSSCFDPNHTTLPMHPDPASLI